MYSRALWTLFALGYFTPEAWSETSPTQLDRTASYGIPYLTPQGDIRSVGMAGSNWVLADSLIATQENPAGLSLTLDQPGIQLARGWLTDPSLFGEGVRLDSTKTQLGGSLSGWGFAFGSNARQVDGNNDLRLQHNSWVLGTSRTFLDRKLSIGFQGMTHAATITENLLPYSGHAFGFGAGFIYRFPRRILVGGSYLSGHNISLDGLPQPVQIPWNAGIGAAFIPNRAFRVGLSLLTFGATPDSRLLLDETRAIGATPTFQPRLGISYRAIELERFRMTLTAGTYFEDSRIQYRSDRVHLTAGIGVSAWIFSLGAGVDTARGYLNRTISSGINLVRTLQWMELIPTWDPAFQADDRALFPDPFVLNEKGLPRNMVDHASSSRRTIDLLEAGQEIPVRLEKRIGDFTQSVEEISSDVLESIGLPELLKNTPQFIPSLDLPRDWQLDAPSENLKMLPSPW